jgi:WD40 repeat protein
MADIFISYARSNGDFVTPLAQSLTEQKLDVWIDFEDIPYTVDWWQRIRQGIDSANNFAVIISDDWIASEVCNEEFQHALLSGKRIIPVLYQSISDVKAVTLTRQWNRQDRSLAEHHWAELQKRNWIDFGKLKFEGVLAALITTAGQDIEYTDKHTQIHTSAQEWQAKGRDNSFLLTGKQIDEAESWLSQSVSKSPSPTPLQMEYIATSRRVQVRQARRLLSGVIVALVVTVILAIISLLLFGVSEERRGQAEEARATAERRAVESQSFALASNAQLAAPNDILLGLALAVEANAIERPPALSQLVLSEIAYTPNVLMRDFPAVEAISVSDLALSPDGNILVVCQLNQRLIFWNFESAQLLFNVEPPACDDDLSFSPDGRILLTSVENEILVWDVARGQVAKRLNAHTDRVTALAISPDGTQALSSAADKRTILWDIASGEIVREYDEVLEAAQALAFMPDGIRFLTGKGLMASASVVLRDLANGRTVKRYPVKNGVSGLAVSPDGSSFVYGNFFFQARVTQVNLRTGEEMRVFEGHAGAATSAKFSPDGRLLLTSSLDQTARLWSVETGEVVEDYPIPDNTINSAVFTPDGGAIVLGLNKGSTQVWSARQTPGALLRQFTFTDVNARDGLVFDAILMPDEKHIFASAGFNVMLLDVETGEVARRFQKPDQGIATGLDLTPDGKMGFTATGDSVGVWNMETGQLLYSLFVQGEFPDAVRVTADGRQVLTAEQERDSLMLWNLDDQALVWKRDGLGMGISDIAVSGNLITVATCAEKDIVNNECARGVVVLVDRETGETIGQLEGHSDDVTAVTFNHDGSRLLSSDADGLVFLWDMAERKVIRRFSGHEGGVKTVSFSPDEKYALSGSNDQTLILWDIESGAALRRLRGHRGTVESAQFFADGRRVLSAGGGLRIVDIRDRYGEILTWRLDLTPEELLRWTFQNRYVRELSCVERQRYNMLCDEGGIFPTRTPYPQSK